MSNAITLDMKTPSIQYLCEKDKRLARVISMVGPITYSLHTENIYSFLVHEIIEQMLSAKAGQKIFNRLETICKGPVSPEAVNALSDEQLREIGISSSKVKSIRGMTNTILMGDLDFGSLSYLPDDLAINRLTALHGIGNWTAKMFLIFVLDRPDVLPFEDGAFLQTYRWLYKTDEVSPESIKKKCKKWRPYSSYAARYMYRALDTGLTKEPFHLYK